MKSTPHKISLVLMMLALTGCVTTSVYAPKSKCSQLVEQVYNEPVPDAPAPVLGEDDLATLKNWINFGVAQTAGKRTEFERAQAARDITRRCEERDAQAIEKSKPKFLGIFG